MTLHLHAQSIHISGLTLVSPAEALGALEVVASPTTVTAADTVPPTTPVRIGQAWPGVEGIYVGIAAGQDGGPNGHLVLLNAKSDDGLNHQAATAWAEALGNGARLPTRFESALIYANARSHVDTSSCHWTSTQAGSGAAWLQLFSYGTQFSTGHSFEGAVRAVRRFDL